MIKETRYKFLATRCVEKLEKGETKYKDPEPLELMNENDLLSIMRIKLFRVQQGIDSHTKCDNLEDLIAYAVVLLERLFPSLQTNISNSEARLPEGEDEK